MNSSLLRVAAVAAIASSLSACRSSDGGSSGSTSGSRPTANAGVDRTVWKGELVSLDGRASRDPEGDALSFQWRQTAGPAVALSDDRAAEPTFVAPRATVALRFTLEVGDGVTLSAADEVTVLVQNRAPRADAGADRIAVVGHVHALDPSASADPDGDPITATWFQRSGPPVALVAHLDGTATFVAPASSAVLEFGLVVSDGEATSAEDGVRVHVVDEASNWPPVASAGPNPVVARRSVVVLQGVGSDREGDPLTFTWTQTAGPSVALLGADGPTPSFVAPAEETDLEFQLVVSDALSSSSDEVTVHVRNQAPVITRLTLSPGAPFTIDPLVASATAVDPDEDPLTLTWQWRRNGTVLEGETGTTLPASLTTRGDVFVARVTVSDGGSLQTSAEASVTIQDSPPVLSVEAPGAVTWGQPMAFTVSASDADGDPVGEVVLIHGPAGMTVSSAGVGAWSPTLPMFDRSLDVHFALGVTGAPSLRVDRTVRVEDTARAYPLRRTGIEIPVWQNGLVATDLDGDGTEELLVAGRTGLYELAHVGTGYAQRWVYPFAAGPASLAAIAARDVDGDGKPEIFVSALSSYYAAPGTVLKLDGASRREAARADLACQDLELADLDLDGAPELVCLAQTASYASLPKAVVLDASTLAVKWQTAELGLGASLALGNVDADAALEIVAAGGYVFDGASGANEWAYSGGFGRAVDTGDLDGDGVEEIVGMDDWGRFRGFSAALRSPLWERTAFDSDALLVADVDADGVPEIVVGDGQWGNVTAYRYRSATNDLAIVAQIDSQDHGVTSIAVGDLDGDGAPELAWGTGGTTSGEDLFVVAGGYPQLAVEWKNVNPSQLDGPFLGAKPARTAPGATPALLFQVPETNSGYSGARLVRLDPVTGALALSAELGSNWSQTGALDVADHDGDGVDEAFLATANLYDGYLVAWDFAAGVVEWTSPKDVGNGRAIVHADLSGDGAPDLVVVTSDGYVQAYDVKRGALLWKSTSLGAGADVEVADVDGDGAPEIVALASTRLAVFRKAPSGPVPWLEAGSMSLSDASDLAVADCDADGSPELYVLTGWGSSRTVRRFDAALTAMGSFAVRGAAQSLYVEDLGSGRKNLVLGKGESWGYGGTATSLEAVDPVTGVQIWESPPLWGTVPVNSLGYVDLDGDGFRELAFGTSLGMYLTR